MVDGIPDGWPSQRPDDGPRTLAERVDDALTRFDSIRNTPGLAAAAVTVTLIVIGATWWFGRATPAEPVETMIPQVTLKTTVAVAEKVFAVVHVTGAVNLPGVYVLSDTARVTDAVDAAGGALPNADLQQLNLAALIVDGMQIRVPLEGEIVTQPSTVSGSTTGPIDLNRADATQLETLPGVGPATAAAIIAFRDEHGSFLTVDDLLDVPGIGPAKLAALADAVVVR